MAEGGLPPNDFPGRQPNDFPGRSLGYGRFYPPNFEVRESLDNYMDVQPLDFSTKRRKASKSDQDDNERCSTIERRVNDLEISARFPFAESSANIHRSRDMEDAFRFSPMSLVIPPEPSTSLTPSHSADPSPSGSLSPVLSPATLARFHSNPLLLSSLQSALNRSSMLEQSRSYLTPGNSPSPSDYSSAGHSNDLDHVPEERVFQSGGFGGLRGASGVGSSGLGVGGLGASSLGIGGGLGVSGLGRRASSSSANPYEDPSHSFDSLGAFSSLSHTLAADNITLLGSAYNTIAAMNSVVSGTSTETVLNEESNACYLKFREEMLKQVHAAKSRRPPPHRPTGPERTEEASNEVSIEGLNENGDTAGHGSEHTEESAAAVADVSNPDVSIDDTENGETSQNSAQEDTSGGARRKTRENSDVVKDEAYWERRRKNNEAAKRSRDARRAKEDEIAIRAAYLEQENIKLKVELSSLKAETSKLRYLFYS